MSDVRRNARALATLAMTMGQQVPAERIAVTARDLVPYDEGPIAAALEQHRRTCRFFPQSSELLAILDPGRYGGERVRRPLWAERTACPHWPACRSITACRDRILDEAHEQRIQEAPRAS